MTVHTPSSFRPPQNRDVIKFEDLYWVRDKWKVYGMWLVD